MNASQHEHIMGILQDFCNDAGTKYHKGAEEHGGDIRDYTPAHLATMALEEAVDQYIYINTLRAKCFDMQAEVKRLEGENHDLRDQVSRLIDRLGAFLDPISGSAITK